jgi:hypothetical protein
LKRANGKLVSKQSNFNPEKSWSSEYKCFGHVSLPKSFVDHCEQFIQKKEQVKTEFNNIINPDKLIQTAQRKKYSSM